MFPLKTDDPAENSDYSDYPQSSAYMFRTQLLKSHVEIASMHIEIDDKQN